MLATVEGQGNLRVISAIAVNSIKVNRYTDRGSSSVFLFVVPASGIARFFCLSVHTYVRRQHMRLP